MDAHTLLGLRGMIHSIGVHVLRAPMRFMEHARHLLAAMESAVPPTMKLVTVVRTIVEYVLTSMSVAMEYANLWKHVQHVTLIVGIAQLTQYVGTGPATVQRIVAHVLGTVAGPADSLRALKDKVWMETETVSPLHLIVHLRCLEVYGPVQSAHVLLEQS